MARFLKSSSDDEGRIYPSGPAGHCPAFVRANGINTPAAVLVIVHEYRAEGNLTSFLLEVVALDDAAALIFDQLSKEVAVLDQENRLLADLTMVDMLKYYQRLAGDNWG